MNYMNIKMVNDHLINQALAAVLAENFGKIRVTLNTEKLGQRMTEIRQKSGNYLLDRGSYAIRKGGIIESSSITLKKWWRIAHNFGDLFTKIEVVDHYDYKKAGKYDFFADWGVVAIPVYRTVFER